MPITPNAVIRGKLEYADEIQFDQLPISLEQTIETDPDEVLVTKGYVDAVVANTNAGEYVFIQRCETFTATAGQRVFTLTEGTYNVNNNQLAVYINGIRQTRAAYTETSESVVTLTVGLEAGDEVQIEYIFIGKVVSFLHNATHAIGGGDEVTPAMIGAVAASEKAVASGVATLSTDSKIPESQLRTYKHVQGVASNVWTITHNLGKQHVSVTVADSAGTICYGEVTLLNTNQCRVTFSSAFSGNAYVV